MLVDQLNDSLPILLLIAVGVVVRITGLVTRETRLVLTRLVYNVTIPAAIFSSIARASISSDLVLLSLIGFVLPCVFTGIMYLATRDIATNPARRGVLLVANVTLVVFAYPFFEAHFGTLGLTRIAVYDVGNALFAGSVALWLAQAFGTTSTGAQGPNWRRILTSPLLVAALAGAAFSFLGIPLSGVLGNTLDLLKSANTPLAMIAVGTFLDPDASHSHLLVRYVGVRMVLGAAVAWLSALVLGLQGVDLIAATVGAGMPAGTTALVYAGQEGLDAEFAASLISGSLLVGILIVTLVPGALSSVYL